MKTLESRGVAFGLITTAGLIIFFFTIKALGLIHNFHLRFLNAVILFAGVYLSIYTFKKQRKGHFEFLEGTGVGLLTTLITAILFTGFVTGYVLANPDFMQAIKAKEPQGIYLNEIGVAIIIFIEAASSGVIFSYLSMQWLKENHMAGQQTQKGSEATEKYRHSHSH